MVEFSTSSGSMISPSVLDEPSFMLRFTEAVGVIDTPEKSSYQSSKILSKSRSCHTKRTRVCVILISEIF